MNNPLMIVGMMLAAALAPVWAAEQAQPATDRKNPPATIAWGEAVDGVQAGLVPLGGMKEAWGNRSLYYVSPSNPFECPNCAGKPVNRSMPDYTAAEKRVCRVCGAPKPWGAAFVAGEPMRLEVHLKNTGKEAYTLYDARWGEWWRFSVTAVGSGKTWDVLLGMPEVERTVESVNQSTIPLAAGQQKAVVFDLGDDRVSFADPKRLLPSVKRLPPGKYTVTASYAHPGISAVNGKCQGHGPGKQPCPYWNGTVTTAPVAIEIKAAEPETDTQRKADSAK